MEVLWRGGRLPPLPSSLLWLGGELQTEPRGDTDTPLSQLSFLLRSVACGLTATASSFLAVAGLPWGDFSALNLW